jgi:predicted deacylase
MNTNIASKYFSESYSVSRTRFRKAILHVGSRFEEFPIDQKDDNGEELTIDFALLGAKKPKWLVIISSGLHGIEGFFGSAVQLAFLQTAFSQSSFPTDSEGAALFIHAINPYGFAMQRRTNENNIDLNRNFLQPNEDYRGTSLEYSLINDFINPKSPPKSFDMFIFKALWSSLRYGFPTLKQAIAEGQYEFPMGLFFGGNSPSKSTQIIQTQLPQWIDSASQIIHLDFHTGLGKWATYKLYPKIMSDFDRYAWVFKQLGVDSGVNKAPYQPQGLMGVWLGQKFAHKDYLYLNAEFGTYSGIKMLERLRSENRAFFYGKPGDPLYKHAKAQLLDAFCPRNYEWRQTVLMDGLTLIKRSLEACFNMYLMKTRLEIDPSNNPGAADG